jgi:hypothetical protein
VPVGDEREQDVWEQFAVIERGPEAVAQKAVREEGEGPVDLAHAVGVG